MNVLTKLEADEGKKPAKSRSVNLYLFDLKVGWGLKRVEDKKSLYTLSC